MSNILTLTLLGTTGLLGITLVGYVLREVRSPVLLRRAHLAAGAAALLALLRAVAQAAAAIPPLPGPTGQLPAGFMACALVLGLLGWVVARYARQGLTIVLSLHVCAGFCGLILAAAWVLRPGT